MSHASFDWPGYECRLIILEVPNRTLSLYSGKMSSHPKISDFKSVFYLSFHNIFDDKEASHEYFSPTEPYEFSFLCTLAHVNTYTEQEPVY
jgi:hypothetical protein